MFLNYKIHFYLYSHQIEQVIFTYKTTSLHGKRIQQNRKANESWSYKIQEKNKKNIET